MKSIMTVLGARPQFIKAACVSRQLKTDGIIREIIVHTGQHYDQNMSQIFFDEMGIPRPDHQLNVGSGNQSKQTADIMIGVEELLEHEKPDMVMVYGDTNSTAAGALAAVKAGCPVMHIESGLRSFNRLMPEEINRVVTDHLSSLLLCPTDLAVANLKREGVSLTADVRAGLGGISDEIKGNLADITVNTPATALQTGDIMYDTSLYYGAKAESSSDIIERLGVKGSDYALLTIHRPENTDDATRLGTIVEAVKKIAQDMQVVWPIHPRTAKALEQSGIEMECEGLLRIAPVGYLDMVMLEKNASAIVTDSGGVQKEAFFQKVACLTLRDQTEWVELTDSGWNTLLSPRTADEICETFRRVTHPETERTDCQPYGSGNTADLICQVLYHCLN